MTLRGGIARQLLDVTQTLQPLRHFFFRLGTAALVRRQALHFFLNRVQHELIHRRVARGLRTLLGLLQQLTFEFDLLRGHSTVSICLTPSMARQRADEKLSVQSYRLAAEFQIARRWWERYPSAPDWPPQSGDC